MEVSITFTSQVIVKGDTIEEIKKKWYDMPIFCVDALEKHHAHFSELISVERIDDNSYEELNF